MSTKEDLLYINLMADKVVNQHYSRLLNLSSERFANQILESLKPIIKEWKEKGTYSPDDLRDLIIDHIKSWYADEQRAIDLVNIYFEWIEQTIKELEERNRIIYERYSLHLKLVDFTGLEISELEFDNFPLNTKIPEFIRNIGFESSFALSFAESPKFDTVLLNLGRFSNIARNIPDFGWLRFGMLSKWLDRIFIVGLILEIVPSILEFVFEMSALAYTEIATSDSRINKFLNKQKPKILKQLRTALEPTTNQLCNDFRSWVKDVHLSTINSKLPIVTILFLASNPSDTMRLRLDVEARNIDDAIRYSQHRDRIVIKQQWATRVSDVQRAILRYKPNIIHFSGHGSKYNEIILENEDGNRQTVSGSAFSKLFALLGDDIRCLVLNACYSEVQANTIAEFIDCVIGMNQEVEDRAAIQFSTAFYQALGFGKDIKTAFELGCSQIELAGLGDKNVPVLLSKNCNPEEVVLIRST